MNDTKKNLITGATGLVGSHLLQSFIQKNIPVRAIYHHTKPKQESQCIEWVQADILDITSLEQALDGIHQVYHCAALVSYDPKDKYALLKCNVEGTANVVNAAINSSVEKLVHVSSVSALGKKKNPQAVSTEVHY